MSNKEEDPTLSEKIIVRAVNDTTFDRNAERTRKLDVKILELISDNGLSTIVTRMGKMLCAIAKTHYVMEGEPEHYDSGDGRQMLELLLHSLGGHMQSLSVTIAMAEVVTPDATVSQSIQDATKLTLTELPNLDEYREQFDLTDAQLREILAKAVSVREHLGFKL